jgi:hypothetical protein
MPHRTRPLPLSQVLNPLHPSQCPGVQWGQGGGGVTPPVIEVLESDDGGGVPRTRKRNRSKFSVANLMIHPEPLHF